MYNNRKLNIDNNTDKMIETTNEQEEIRNTYKANANNIQRVSYESFRTEKNWETKKHKNKHEHK